MALSYIHKVPAFKRKLSSTANILYFIYITITSNLLDMLRTKVAINLLVFLAARSNGCLTLFDDILSENFLENSHLQEDRLLSYYWEIKSDSGMFTM